MATVRSRANGNGAAVQPTDPAKQQARENIFLFIPNLIGMVISYVFSQPR